ncbi:asparagine synthase-related protein [Haloechinothrix sp. LS1_15]|uniref:asparagine synthase-related protein n=1 Tax=Haloechinothrix sp. LS1_15 TaxID=2652248 RepID=UPI0029445BA5|nr:asparagine synthase-related protein [Haloechinothrix sp. LS1_15]MDV6011086.1 hypothetical protein [Haloechinothrix sp. LS1_15]
MAGEVVGEMTGATGEHQTEQGPWLRVCGSLGGPADDRVAAMGALLGEPPSLIDRQGGSVRGNHGTPWTEGGTEAVSWSPSPLPGSLPTDAREIAERHDAATLAVPDSGTPYLHAGISGAAPLYVDTAPVRAGSTSHFCSHVDPLARTRRGPLRPDWDAWAQIIAMGGPLEGRTPFEGIRRLAPYERLTTPAEHPQGGIADGWPWLEVTSSGDATLDPLRDALVEAVAALGGRTRLAPLLSGGWDSRILASLAAHTTGDTTGTAPAAWTTSSDTGTVLEELVAARVAGKLGLAHTIVAPRRDEFARDLDEFARAVDYQTSFHVWLVPLARALAGNGRTVLDGLGGGVFVGGAFADDDSDRPAVEKRFALMAKYLDAVDVLLHPTVARQIRNRTRAAFENAATPLADHPYGNTFTAYLTRTLPGISLAPFGLVARGNPVATPFLADSVVRAALAIPPERHADGALYAPLLRPLAPEVAGLPTAAETPQPRRHHRRRVASAEAAERFRTLLNREPVRGLLSPRFATESSGTWRWMLNRTGYQHVIRSVATLALWLESYGDLLDDTGTGELLERAA